MKTKPFLSIVIPTRNRHETLQHTIKTVLEQNFNDYELIICDNHSSKETKEVTNSFKSKKIKYIRSDIDLAMSDNWELALSAVEGKYITVIADNDGFIQDSLAFLHELIQLNNYPHIVRWEKNLYNWPDLDTVNKNTMFLNTKTSLKKIDGLEAIKKVISGDIKFQTLPMIYNSAISYKLVQELKDKAGRIFKSASPDIYTGFAFAYLSDQYLSLQMPITIGANSSKSNGYNSFRKSNNIQKEFIELSKISYHPKMPFVKSLTAAIAESYLRVQEELQIEEISLNRKETIKRIVDNVLVYDKEELISTKEKILKSCEDDNDLLDYSKKLLLTKQIPIAASKESNTRVSLGFYKNTLILDATKFSVSNIYDASIFMSNFYTYSIKNTNLPEIFGTLKEIPQKQEVAIYGTGSSSKLLQKNIFENRPDIIIRYLIDSYEQNLSAKPKIITPKNIDDIKYIIIASMYVVEINNTLNRLELGNNTQIYKYVSKKNC